MRDGRAVIPPRFHKGSESREHVLWDPRVRLKVGRPGVAQLKCFLSVYSFVACDFRLRVCHPFKGLSKTLSCPAEMIRESATFGARYQAFGVDW